MVTRFLSEFRLQPSSLYSVQAPSSSMNRFRLKTKTLWPKRLKSHRQLIFKILFDLPHFSAFLMFSRALYRCSNAYVYIDSCVPTSTWLHTSSRFHSSFPYPLCCLFSIRFKSLLRLDLFVLMSVRIIPFASTKTRAQKACVYTWIRTDISKGTRSQYMPACGYAYIYADTHA